MGYKSRMGLRRARLWLARDIWFDSGETEAANSYVHVALYGLYRVVMTEIDKIIFQVPISLKCNANYNKIIYNFCMVFLELYTSLRAMHCPMYITYVSFSATQFTLALSDTYFSTLNPTNEARMVAKCVFTLVANDWHSFDAVFKDGLSARYIYVYITEMAAPTQYIGFNEIEAFTPFAVGKSYKYGLNFIVSIVDHIWSWFIFQIIIICVSLTWLIPA